jgi:endonuclease/exonuclease/phosphatase family metal-dependent hydrolase
VEAIIQEGLLYKEQGRKLLLVGDFNGHTSWRSCKPSTITALDKNGRRLLNITRSLDMTVMNASEKCKGKVTWTRGDQTSTIDYMLAGPQLQEKTSSMYIDEEAKCTVGSDCDDVHS